MNQIPDQLLSDQPEVYDKVLYVEQPFAYHLAQDMLDVRSLSAHKPLLLDESAHDWEYVQLSWNGVALKLYLLLDGIPFTSQANKVIVSTRGLRRKSRSNRGI